MSGVAYACFENPFIYSAPQIKEYAVDGFYVTNGRFRHTMDLKYAKVVISQDHGYFEYFSKKSPIQKNYDSTIYTAPQLKDVPMDGSPTPENIILDISNYNFKSNLDK